MSPLERLLESYRTAAISERDKGTAFEKLVAAWLVVDPVQSKRFAKVELWPDWARRQELDRTDTGIDLVGTLHDGGFAAIQCKFFAADRHIRKDEIDSFMNASGKMAFAERLIVETTDRPWSKNAETMLHGQAIPTAVIGLRALRDSHVDWSAFAATGEIARPEPKTLRQDQVEALEAVRAGLADADRGKLIMACGTGKTLTGLRIAEELAGSGSQVLFLVPSLALMAQTVREWCADAVLPLTAFAVCSDTQVGRRRRSRHDVAELEVTDLAFPATTDAASLARAVAASDANSMRVVFATYQSISVIGAAQASHGLSEFDLIVCDEAHRTTGVTFAGEDQSNFVKVHDNDSIRGRKRLYMTATPRIYGENAKSKAHDTRAVLASMDDPGLYGDVLFHHGFARAVESGILTDYRVIVLVMDEGQVSAAVQKRLADQSSELLLDDATKIVGCWKALSKTGLAGTAVDDPGPMRRALAFCRSINSSKLVRNEFEQVVAEFQAEIGDEERNGVLCEVRHVDGTYNARDRGQRLDWLKEDAGANACRILSNARCLTEGVDVPALDAILFLHPRNSQIDVVQAVGRVMRRAPNKRMGYVILPVGVPPGVPADVALGDNEKYRVVWQILNALRAHDERLDATINQGGLGQDVSDRIAVVEGRSSAASAELRAVTAQVRDIRPRYRAGPGIGRGISGGSEDKPEQQEPLPLVIDEFSRAVMAKIVEKCGTREYWEDWAKDVAQIAERHVTRITSLVQEPDTDASSFFQDFLLELRDDLNESITEHDAIEMLAQHLITRPVFDALFEGHAFVDRNPVSVAMTEVLSVIDEAQVEREAKALEGFYASVRRRAAGITDPLARQNLIVELYDKFFRGAFPRTTQKLGIVYTPVEIVDFIIRSVNEALQEEFGQTLGSQGVHILDPFAGTGTFITRLLQSGLIPPEDLERKYREEIHANEIVLLAYYIAAINIESVFHSVADRSDYVPYTGICLTDTFALHEGDDELSFYMKDNTDRRERQKGTHIRVIVGNPPWSAGQRISADANPNTFYPGLARRVAETYAARSTATLKSSLHDTYKMAIRWASDRIGEQGVVAFVTNGSWIDGNVDSGVRACLAEEFSSIWVLNLRGNQRTQGERSRKEGGKVFGQGSRAPVTITILVRNPDAKRKGCRILYRDVGDYLKREEKLALLCDWGGIDGITDWQEIRPNRHQDWIDQRNEDFQHLYPIGSKQAKAGKSDEAMFGLFSSGYKTSRDAYLYNFSRAACAENARLAIEDYMGAMRDADRLPATPIDQVTQVHQAHVRWDRELKNNLKRRKSVNFSPANIWHVQYRPFVRQHCYVDYVLVNAKYQMDLIFPFPASQDGMEFEERERERERERISPR